MVDGCFVRPILLGEFAFAIDAARGWIKSAAKFCRNGGAECSSFFGLASVKIAQVDDVVFGVHLSPGQTLSPFWPSGSAVSGDRGEFGSDI